MRVAVNDLRRTYAIPAKTCHEPRAQNMRGDMSEIRNHRDLEAWHVAMDLTLETYRLTDTFPSKEMYGLQSQMRRAAISVPSNIAA